MTAREVIIMWLKDIIESLTEEEQFGLLSFLREYYRVER